MVSLSAFTNQFELFLEQFDPFSLACSRRACPCPGMGCCLSSAPRRGPMFLGSALVPVHLGKAASACLWEV